MKYLKTYKIFENEETVENDNDILEDLTLWDMSYIWNDKKRALKILFDFPDRIDKNELITINKVLKKLKPNELDISVDFLESKNNQYDILKNLELNSNLKKFYCDYLELKELPKLPKGLEFLSCRFNNLEKFPEDDFYNLKFDVEGNNLPFENEVTYKIWKVTKKDTSDLPDKSWFNGKHKFDGLKVTIDSSLGFIAVDDENDESLFYIQDSESFEEITDNMYYLWCTNDNFTEEDAIKQVISNYLY